MCHLLYKKKQIHLLHCTIEKELQLRNITRRNKSTIERYKTRNITICHCLCIHIFI